MKILILAVLAGCSSQNLLSPPKKPCPIVYEEPERGVKHCISRWQLEEMMRTSR